MTTYSLEYIILGRGSKNKNKNRLNLDINPAFKGNKSDLGNKTGT